jgi:hypothetical protein
MYGRKVPAAVALLLLALAAAGLLAWREQQAANRAVLARLDEAGAALSDQSRRTRELADQVTALGERVGRLEADNRDLRRQLARVLRSRPTEVAALSTPAPVLNATALAPLAEHQALAEPAVVVEPLPITWSTDFTAYQPAGIVAPAPSVVLSRKLTDPSFFRKMYIAHGALQAADVATTLAAINRGAREANPLMQGAAGHPAALVGVKAAATVATVFTVEQVRKRNPTAAIVALVAINSTLAVVAVHNARVAASMP